MTSFKSRAFKHGFLYTVQILFIFAFHKYFWVKEEIIALIVRIFPFLDYPVE